MMSVRLRVAGLVARWLLAGRRRPDQPFSRVPLRCWPWDCDVYLHMNNARYLSMMDLGRWDFVFVTGLWRRFRDERTRPIAARVEIDFRRSIKPFEQYVLETRLHRVGSRSVVLSQRFLVGDEAVAEALITLAFVRDRRTVEVAPVLAGLPHLLDGRADAPSAGGIPEPASFSAPRGT